MLNDDNLEIYENTIEKMIILSDFNDLPKCHINIEDLFQLYKQSAIEAGFSLNVN